MKQLYRHSAQFAVVITESKPFCIVTLAGAPRVQIKTFTIITFALLWWSQIYPRASSYLSTVDLCVLAVGQIFEKTIGAEYQEVL